jgi:hypothetical protein
MTSHCPNHDRSPTLQINIKNLIDDVQCYQTVRELRWPEVVCPNQRLAVAPFLELKKSKRSFRTREALYFQ